MRRRNDRGLVLIASYLLLSAFLIYTNALAVHTLTQQLAADRLREGFQAVGLTQGAVEQLHEDLYVFFRSQIYQIVWQSNAIPAMQWLDALDPDSSIAPNPPLTFEDALREDPYGMEPAELLATGDGTLANPRRINLPSGGPLAQGQAWVVAVERLDAADPLSPRDVTIEAVAVVGSVTKRLRATYRFALGMSDIFRYAYFVNNYGWFDTGGSTTFIQIDGEVRSNGNFQFSGTSRLYVNGDLYASANDALVDPRDPFKPVAQGLIKGDPNEDTSMGWYWGSKKQTTRPELRLTFPGQPVIGEGLSGMIKRLESGRGWDSEYPNVNDPDQRKFGICPGPTCFGAQAIQDIPYLGDLSLYAELASQFNGGSGSTLTYNIDADGDGIFGESGEPRPTMNAAYDSSKGPDQIAGTSDDGMPLVLVGTSSQPIIIDGPVVVPGDVIIKGRVTGQGTIYAGRNVHIVGDIRYSDPPVWPSLWRHQGTGEVGGYVNGGWSDLGSVCVDGTYVPASAGPPAGRCP